MSWLAPDQSWNPKPQRILEGWGGCRAHGKTEVAVLASMGAYPVSHSALPRLALLESLLPYRPWSAPCALYQILYSTEFPVSVLCFAILSQSLFSHRNLVCSVWRGPQRAGNRPFLGPHCFPEQCVTAPVQSIFSPHTQTGRSREPGLQKRV